MKAPVFELGDGAVVILNGSHHTAFFNRSPRVRLEGTVTARGQTCVRIKWKWWGMVWRERWFSTSSEFYTVEKTDML